MKIIFPNWVRHVLDPIPEEVIVQIGERQLAVITRARAAQSKLVIPADEREIKACERLAERALLKRINVRGEGSERIYLLTQYGNSAWLVVRGE